MDNLVVLLNIHGVEGVWIELWIVSVYGLYGKRIILELYTFII